VIDLARRIAASRFLRFAIVGTGGFLVDEAVLYFATRQMRLDPYTGRAISFFCAVTFTWWGNRMLTFRDRAAREGLLQEWAKFFAANALGGAVNYGTYAALVALAPKPLGIPFVALGCGAITGLFFNFAMSRAFVFRGPSFDEQKRPPD
jgi:putative flippase GtrA